MNTKTTTIVSALLIAAGLLALGLCLRSGLTSFTARDRVVDVKGLAERSRCKQSNLAHYV